VYSYPPVPIVDPPPPPPRTTTTTHNVRALLARTQVHWALTVDANNATTNYLNGSVSTAVTSSTSWCGEQGGSLIIGHDQVRTVQL
jgi:hypothetical protein